MPLAVRYLGSLFRLFFLGDVRVQLQDSDGIAVGVHGERLRGLDPDRHRARAGGHGWSALHGHGGDAEQIAANGLRTSTGAE